MVLSIENTPPRALAPSLIRVAFLCVALICCLPAVSMATIGPELDKVKLQLRWYHQFQFAGYYAAKAKGFYEDVGLDVEILERDIKENPVQAVLAGKADFGASNSEILIHYMAGKPIVALAAIFQHSPLVLLTTKPSNIITPHDLIGKRVLMSTKTMDVELLGMLQKEDVSLESIHVVDRFSRKADYFDPTIDAIAAYITNQPYFLNQSRIPYFVLYPSSYGIDFYGDCLFTTENQIKSYPHRVKLFRDATIRGWKYAMDHTDEIIDILLTEYKCKKSREHLVYEASAMKALILPRLVEVGHMNPGRWAHILQIFSDLGIVQSERPLKDFIYSPESDVQNAALEHFIYIMIGVALALAIGSAVLGVFNYKLQSQVQQRTEDLTVQAQELEKANQRLQDLDRVKSALLSSVSHELRTPLTSVLGFVKLISKEFDKTFVPLVGDNQQLKESGEKIAKNVRIISVEGERLARLISDVLDLSKIESGKVEWRDTDIDIADLARTAAAVVQEQFARNPDTQLSVDVEDDLPVIHADPDRIIQVVINLLANAAKFTLKGEVNLAVRRLDERSVTLIVRDTGIGVAESDIGEIFNMFHQVRRSDTVRLGAEGAGLGLAISREIVEHYGGTISLESTLGVGSTFTVVLPSKSAESTR